MPDILEVLAGIIEKDGKILIGRRKEGKLKDMWEFPGGKLEKQESHQKCLEREFMEEFEVIIKVGEYFGENVHEYPWGTIKIIAYNIEYFSGEFKLKFHSEIAWVLPTEFKNYDFVPADISLAKRVLENYSKKAIMIKQN